MKKAKATPFLSVPLFLIYVTETYIEREVPPHEVLGVFVGRLVEVVAGLLDQLDEGSEELVVVFCRQDLDLYFVFEEGRRVVRADSLVVRVFLQHLVDFGDGS